MNEKKIKAFLNLLSHLRILNISPSVWPIVFFFGKFFKFSKANELMNKVGSLLCMWNTKLQLARDLQIVQDVMYNAVFKTLRVTKYSGLF